MILSLLHVRPKLGPLGLVASSLACRAISPALFLILVILVDPLLSSPRDAFKEHTGPAIFLPLWLKNLLWLPSTLGIMDKLHQPIRACLAFEHYLLSYRDLVFGFSFLKNTKFVSRACAPGHLPAAEAFGSASFSCYSPAYCLCVPFSQRPPCSCRCGHPDLGISLPTPTTDSPSCCKGLAAVNLQLSALGGNALNYKEPLTQGHTPFPEQYTDRSSFIVLTASNCGVSSATLLPARPCVNHS